MFSIGGEGHTIEIAAPDIQGEGSEHLSGGRVPEGNALRTEDQHLGPLSPPVQGARLFDDTMITRGARCVNVFKSPVNPAVFDQVLSQTSY